jgi:hypothetical protein
MKTRFILNVINYSLLLILMRDAGITYSMWQFWAIFALVVSIILEDDYFASKEIRKAYSDGQRE